MIIYQTAAALALPRLEVVSCNASRLLNLLELNKNEHEQRAMSREWSNCRRSIGAPTDGKWPLVQGVGGVDAACFVAGGNMCRVMPCCT